MVFLNHIGIAVANLPELKRLFALLEFNAASSEAVPEQGVITHFLPIQLDATGGNLELLEPTDPEGTVAKFLQKRGPGIHHLSFTVQRGQLDNLLGKLRANGIRLIYEKPKSGAHGMRINFIHPASAGGMLIELMEKA
jgi:methylmalonyl-CoA/ethylmalonyl-CoA epimerase